MPAHCRNCDALLPLDARFCSACGSPVPVTGPTQRLSDEGMTASRDQSTYPPPFICPKCSHSMERGFIADGSHAGPNVFIEGKPDYSAWYGGINIDERRVWVLRGYRCRECGYIEFYGKTEIKRD
jgi:hypothetical protein